MAFQKLPGQNGGIVGTCATKAGREMVCNNCEGGREEEGDSFDRNCVAKWKGRERERVERGEEWREIDI